MQGDSFAVSLPGKAGSIVHGTTVVTSIRLKANKDWMRTCSFHRMVVAIIFDAVVFRIQTLHELASMVEEETSHLVRKTRAASRRTLTVEASRSNYHHGSKM